MKLLSSPYRLLELAFFLYLSHFTLSAPTNLSWSSPTTRPTIPDLFKYVEHNPRPLFKRSESNEMRIHFNYRGVYVFQLESFI